MSEGSGWRNSLLWMTRTYLAYTLKNGYCVFEKADMKDRNDKLNVGIVANAVDCVESAGFTERILF